MLTETQIISAAIACCNLGILSTKDENVFIEKRLKPNSFQYYKKAKALIKRHQQSEKSHSQKEIDAYTAAIHTKKDYEIKTQIGYINTVGKNTILYGHKAIKLTKYEMHQTLDTMLLEYEDFDGNTIIALNNNRKATIKDPELTKKDRLYNFLNAVYNCVKYLYPERKDANNQPYKSVDSNIVEGFQIMLNLKKKLNPYSNHVN